MSSISALNQQLSSIDTELEDFKVKNRRYIRLENLVNYSETAAGWLAFIIVVILEIIISKIFKRYIDDWLRVLMVYGGILLTVVLFNQLNKLFIYLLHHNFKISGQELTKFKNQKSEFSLKRFKVQDEIRAEIRKLNEQKEQDFKNRLNEAVNTITKRRLSLSDAGTLIAELRATYAEIKKTVASLHTYKYYDNRFDKLQDELKHYLDPKPQENKTTPRSFIDLKTFKITTEGSEEPKKEEPKPIIPKETESPKTTTPSVQVTKPIETTKSSVTPVQQTKSAEQPKPQTEEKIALEKRKEHSIIVKLKLLKILAEARFEQRLFDFWCLLTKKTCPPKAKDYIYRLLLEEFENYKTIGFFIHEKGFYENQLKDIQYLVYPKPSAPAIKEEPAPMVTESITESKNVTAAFNDFKEFNQPKEDIYVEKDINDLFKDLPKPKPKVEGELKNFKVVPKQDFEALNSHRNNIGKLGEEFVFEEEKRKLTEAGLPLYVQLVKWVSQVSDSYGYDISSMTEDGHLKYIEVKTTTGDHKAPFEVSEAELNAMRTLERYYICRVFNFDIETKKGSKFTMSREQFEKHYKIEPTSYKARPKPPDDEVDPE